MESEMRPQFTPNDYSVEGDQALIELRSRRGGILAEAVVDACDLERVLAFGRWTARFDRWTNSFYTTCNQPRIDLHRFIVSAVPGQIVDHIDRDTLNCRNSNLRFCTKSQNGQNRKYENGIARSGVRNVVWDCRRSMWRVRINKDGHKYDFGSFADVEEAAIVAERERKKLHGEFAS